MNRSARRKLAANAETLSVLMAASCLGYSKAGALGRIKDAGVTKALEGAFASMLRQGGEPVVIQIGNEVANAFPFQSVPDVIFASLAKTWLAVGIDRAGRGPSCRNHPPYLRVFRHSLQSGITPCAARVTRFSMPSQTRWNATAPSLTLRKSVGVCLKGQKFEHPRAAT